MGASKGNGYTKVPTVTEGQQSFLEQLLKSAAPNFNQAAQGFAQFLPGGEGGQAIANAAQQRFQQQTIPSIMNAFGSGAKSSSALNQALAAGAANLNTDIASLLSQMQLQAAGGLGSQGLQQAGLGSTPLFAYLQKQPSKLQGALKGAVAGGAAGAPAGPWGSAVGAGIGALGSLF
jgi:hypothetical protein